MASARNRIVPRLVYFEQWFDPVAETMLDKPGEITLTRLSYDSPTDVNWATLATAHGYQARARNELREPWFVTPAFLANCPALLAVSSAGAGHDVIDVGACTAAGVVVVNQSGSNSESVAEHTFALMLSISKHVGKGSRAITKAAARDRWQFLGHEIAGKTLGIVGIGNIGRRVARYGRAFGMQVLAYDPWADEAEVAKRGARKVEFRVLLAESDIVTVHCPRSTQTIGMFGSTEFALMKPGSYFINTARGGIHDEKALHAVLLSGHLAGAGLDVFDDEPPKPDNPLITLDCVIATPHIAGVTAEAFYSMSEASATQWLSLFAGAVPQRLVNPEAWPAYSSRFEELLGWPPAALRR